MTSGSFTGKWRVSGTSRTPSIHNPYTSALYHSNQPLPPRALEAPVAYALACLRSDVVHGEGPVAKRLASRRRRARRRANRIHMGAADGGKGELIAVGRVVPEEFAGPRTAEGGGSRRARRRYDGRVDEAGDHHAVASKACKLALERGRICRAIANQDSMTFVVEPACLRVCAGRRDSFSESSAEAGARPVDCARMRKGPHGGMLIGKEPRDELEWVRLKRQLVVDKERLPRRRKEYVGKKLGNLGGSTTGCALDSNDAPRAVALTAKRRRCRFVYDRHEARGLCREATVVDRWYLVRQRHRKETGFVERCGENDDVATARRRGRRANCAVQIQEVPTRPSAHVVIAHGHGRWGAHGVFPRGPRRRYRAERFGIGALTRSTPPCEGPPPWHWHSHLGARGRPVVDAVAREARRDRRTPEVPTRPPEADGAARAVTRPVFARAPRPRAWTAGGSRAGHREEVCNGEARHGHEESRGSLPRVIGCQLPARRCVLRVYSREVWPHIFDYRSTYRRFVARVPTVPRQLQYRVIAPCIKLF